MESRVGERFGREEEGKEPQAVAARESWTVFQAMKSKAKATDKAQQERGWIRPAQSFGVLRKA